MVAIDAVEGEVVMIWFWYAKPDVLSMTEAMNNSPINFVSNLYIFFIKYLHLFVIFKKIG
jgi:hypothetical protein